MTNMDTFRCLGISPTKNIDEIKQAYQALLPRNHPEENPEGFMCLHDAYKTAMAYAKGTGSSHSYSESTFSWQPEKTRPAQAETAYDSLFSNLEEEPAADIPKARQAFSRKLRRLRLHWLPVPLKKWREFFAGEAFLLCRGEQSYMEALFALLERKIHTYGVLCFLISKLWELESWQSSENMQTLASKTRRCIQNLKDQYKYYGNMNAEKPAKRLLYPVFWYYQALPFYFRLPVSAVLLPLMSFGSTTALIWLLLIFYFVEIITAVRKWIRNLGIFHPIPKRKKGVMQYKAPSDSPWLVVGTIYAVLFHLGMCISFWESFFG